MFQERFLVERVCGVHLSTYVTVVLYRGLMFGCCQVWDSDKLHTCLCDTGYHGFDCALRNCPTGDDPLTTGQVNEIQLVVCEVRLPRASFFVWVYYSIHGSRVLILDMGLLYPVKKRSELTDRQSIESMHTHSYFPAISMYVLERMTFSTLHLPQTYPGPLSLSV